MNIKSEAGKEDVWDPIKHAIVEVEQEELVYTSPKTKKDWTTKEILLMIENRRTHKHKNTNK